MNHSVLQRCARIAVLLAAGTALAQPAAFAERYSPVQADAERSGLHGLSVMVTVSHIAATGWLLARLG